MNEEQTEKEEVRNPNQDQFDADDRGNVVDFYEGEERIARLDREAELNGEVDQYVFMVNFISPEFESWLCDNDWSSVLFLPRDCF